jgi:hypothetical protein
MDEGDEELTNECKEIRQKLAQLKLSNQVRRRGAARAQQGAAVPGNVVAGAARLRPQRMPG